MEVLAELIQVLPGELARITDKMRTSAELLRLAVKKLQRDAETKNRNIEAISHRTADIEGLVEDLADLATKAGLIEPLAVKLEGADTEHPKTQQEKE